MAPKPPTTAQIAALKKSKGVKPTAAITKPGQKPTGLAPRTPAPVGKRTPIKNAGSGFAGSGMPLGASLGVSKITKGNVANAALAATLLPGSGQVTRYVAGKAGSIVASAAFKASTKGFGASGAGGKVKNVMTPFGKTLGSTSIGSAGQQSARMGNLEIAKAKEAARAGFDVANQAVRGMNKTGKVVKRTSVVGVGGKAIVDKKKKK
jgi:hypothetical protein